MAKPGVLILKFPYSSTYGGGEKHTLTLVERLQDTFDFHLLSTCTVLVPEFQKREWSVKRAWAGIEPVTPISLFLFLIQWPFILVNLMRHLRRYKQTQKIQAIICLSLTEKVLVTPWAHAMGLRVLWIEHLQLERSLLSSPLRWLYVWWSKYATVVTVVDAVKQQLMQLGVDERQINVIYNGVDATQWTPLPSTTPLETSYELLYVGRLAPEKGIDDLIDAVALLKQQIPDVYLNIVGEGSERAALEKRVQEKQLTDVISFAGFQNDIRPWMQHAHVCILPSRRRETFGIIIAEALASEKPVVVTRMGGVPEVVGDCGWIVEPNHPKQLAAALTAVYQQYPEALTKAKQGRLRVLQLFSEDRMIEAYRTLLK